MNNWYKPIPLLYIDAAFLDGKVPVLEEMLLLKGAYLTMQRPLGLPQWQGHRFIARIAFY